MTSLLAEEIASQPEAISRLIDREAERVQALVATLPPVDFAVIAARGTSDHAAIYAQYAWGGIAGLPVALATPSLYTIYHTPPRMRGALVVGISQSGESPDIVGVLEEGRRQGRPTIAITNNEQSPLARVADHVIPLHAGPERSVAATKTYTTQLTAIALLAAAFAGRQDRLDELRRLPDTVSATLDSASVLAPRAERYRFMEQCVVLGRGFAYPSALELALKLKELTYVQAQAYSSADFRHGPIATIGAGSPVVLLMPRGEAFADMLELAHELWARGAELLVASDDPTATALATTALPLPVTLPEWLSPITAIVPGQLFALHLTLVRGLDPDRPRGLQKVTRTL